MSTSATIALLVLILQPLVSVGGAAWYASYAITMVRKDFPLPTTRPVSLLYRAVYAPRYARILAVLLAAVVSVGASAFIALATGTPIGSAIDATLAAMLAGLGSQLIHGLTLSTEVPAVVTDQEVVLTLEPQAKEGDDA